MKLYEQTSPDAFHNAQERHREVDRPSLVEVVNRWTPHLQDRSSFAESFAVEDVLRDIFTWVCDPFIPRFPLMWVNGNNRCQSALIAQAVADILSQRGELSAAFFFPQEKGSSRKIAASVIPSIAYQLAENIPPARGYILHTIRNDPATFDLRLSLQAQMKKLITDPLWKAFESRATSHSNIILIHALEDCEDEDFQESLLDAFSQAQKVLEPKLALKLLVLGQHTAHLSDCFARLAGRSMVLRRPIDSGHWLVVEEQIYRKEIALRKRKEELAQMKKHVEKMEEELKKRRDHREHQSKEHDDTSSGCPGVHGGPSPDCESYISFQVVLLDPYPVGHPISAYKSAGTSYRDNRPSISVSTLSRQSNISSHSGNSDSIPPTVSRSATIDGSSSNTQSPITQQFGKPSNSIMGYSTKIPIPPGPWSPSSFSSSRSSNTVLSMEHNGRIPLQTTDSHEIPTLPSSYAIQTATEDLESTWKTDDNGVVVAGTLEGLVQFLVTTIGEWPYDWFNR